MWKKTTTILSIMLVAIALSTFVLIDNLSVKPIPNAYAQATGPAVTPLPTHTFTPQPTQTFTPVSTAAPCALVSLSPSTMAVGEGMGTVILNANLDSPQGVSIGVAFNSLIVLPDYAAASIDYSAISSVTFQPGEQTKQIAITILQDIQTEPAESFDVVISSITSGCAAINTTANQSRITILDDDFPTNTPVPADTNTLVPADTNTSVPADTNTPIPADTNTPVPADTNTPIPADTNTPIPADTNTPVPADTNTSVPADTNTPVPAGTNTSAPADTNTPIPVDTNTSVPADTNTSVPADTNTPVPADTNTPVPADTNTSVPADTNTPIPTDTDTPVPADTNTPVPADTNTPVPADTNTSVPADTNTPIPADTDTPVPADTDTPVPADTNTPVPADTNTSVPADTNTPIPADTNTPIPADPDTPAPTDTNTPIPAGTDTPVPAADTVTPVPTETRVLPPQNPNIDLNVDPITDPADIFDPEGPEPEEVTESVDPETGESTDPRLRGIIYQTKVRAENNPGDRNELEPILPGGIAIFAISITNNTPNPLYGVVIRMVIPPFMIFQLEGSGLFPLSQVIAARTSDEGDPPDFENVVANLHENRGTEWELADGSGPCPDGAPAGTECIYRLGTVLPGESSELSIPTKIDEDAPIGETFEMGSTLGAANLDQGLLVALNDPASVETVTQLPTGLPSETEPNNGVRLYLPFISH